MPMRKSREGSVSARKSRDTEDKPTRKKLRLSKETLKDLTDADGGVKGGGQQITDKISCSCVGC
jgi:hypothetical protein